MVDASRPKSGVKGKDGFRVAAGVEMVAVRLLLLLQFLKVVDLAVEDNTITAVLRPHRLMTTGEIDDGKARVANGERAFLVETRTVGAAVVKKPTGVLQTLFQRQFAAKIESVDTAHINRCVDM